MTESQKPSTTFADKIQAKWSKFSEGDIRSIGSDMTILASKISSVYKRSKEDAEKEIKEFQKSMPK